MAIRGILLDVDGTLVLSNDAQAQAWVEAFKAHDRDVPFDKVRPLIGMGGDKVVPELAPGLSGEDGEGKKIADTRKELMMTQFGPTLRPAPGSRAFVERAQQEGLTLVVASSATTEELETLLKVARVDDLLHERTTMDDAGQSKPAPDIVAVALEKSGVPAGEAVMIGDSPYDIASAAQVGVGTIALRGLLRRRSQGGVGYLRRPGRPARALRHIALARGVAAGGGGGARGNDAGPGGGRGITNALTRARARSRRRCSARGGAARARSEPERS